MVDDRDETKGTAEKRYEPRKQPETYTSAEFRMNTVKCLFQSRVWNFSSRGMCLLLKEDSSVLEKGFLFGSALSSQGGCTPPRWITLLIAGMLLMSAAAAAAEPQWGMTLYGARLTINSFGDTLFGEATYEDSHLVALGVSRKIGTYKDLIRFEVEGQAVKHFGDQDHEEFNALVVARWLPFPWDRFLDTSFAVGEGISYATADPALENKGQQWLNYILLELAFAAPSLPQWEAVVRVHHRSGVFGLYNGVRDASNALGFGIRYRF